MTSNQTIVHFFYLSFSIFFLSQVSPVHATLKAVVQVHEEAVTEYDIEQRIALNAFFLGLDAKEALVSLRLQTIKNLIDESIQRQTVKRQNVTLTKEEEAEVQKIVAGMSAQHGLSKEAFEKELAQRKISLKTLENRVRAQKMWAKLVQSLVTDHDRVLPAELESFKKFAKANLNKKRFELMEITFRVDPGNPSKKGGQELNGIEKRLKDPDFFQKYAKSMSQSPTASKGGYLGWVALDEISDPCVKAVLEKSCVGSITSPILTDKGYQIFYIRDIQNPGESPLGEAQISIAEGVIPDETSIPNLDIQVQICGLKENLKKAKNCDEFVGIFIKNGLHAEKYENISVKNIKNSKEFLNLKVGSQMTPLVEVSNKQKYSRHIMLCSRTHPPSQQMPSDDEIGKILSERKFAQLSNREISRWMGIFHISYPTLPS